MARKIKLPLMSLGDIPPLKFNEKDWQFFNGQLQLPEEARQLIERMVSLYQFHKHNHQGGVTPSAALVELRAIDQLAKRLLMKFQALSERASYVLLDNVGNVDRQTAGETWSKRINTVKEIADTFPKALSHKTLKKEKKSGQNSFAIDKFVEQMDDLLSRHTNKTVGRNKAMITCLEAMLSYVDAKITYATVKSATKRFVKQKRNEVNK